MAEHPLSDALIAQHWPDEDPAEIRRQFDALMEDHRRDRAKAARERPKRPSILNCGGSGLLKLQDTLHAGDRSILRRELIFAAGAANNRRLVTDLGSMEGAAWFEGRRAADPDFVNPYWPDKG